MTVDSIESKASDRCIVIAGGESVLSSPAVIAELRLFQGKTIDREQLEELKLLSVRYLAREKAVEILSRRMMSEGELKRKLIDKGLEEGTAEYASAWCRDQGLVNDSYYAEAIVRHYSAKGYGAGRIRAEFSKRYISRELWDEALMSRPEASDTIDRIIATRLKKYVEKNERDKLYASLLRRGYSRDEIVSAIERAGNYD